MRLQIRKQRTVCDVFNEQTSGSALDTARANNGHITSQSSPKPVLDVPGWDTMSTGRITPNGQQQLFSPANSLPLSKLKLFSGTANQVVLQNSIN